jgi:predicted enzyme related to lactoylglutathione lyase
MQTEATVSHVRLLVEEYAASFRFYRDVVGLTPTFGDEDSGYADFDTGDVTLALFATDEMAAAVDRDPGEPRGGRDQAAVVLRVDDVDETAADLRAEGIDLVAEPTDHPEWGIRTVHCRDPDGTLLECNEPLEA